ncbi:hypothetical protein COU95_03295 [Candidatus Shapirobacteria bacterium CG10_big_fil_rev_8_21_14_0_10_40_9]|uniref:Uncharacterized protein n=1 Tax=Candidatus Shapirobacteria bacterium CG10_big_fil_rev_8_21_14_0_10_40_9 TaxID=1974888 RepID=A0A2M8L2X0_9BACT|nr:MAG: hypothetical protein COU95_03295 [Candidatus Shapirobacteria bacterium CG10_big_fil_rev_8_21_14_0_10_40_9]
MGKVVKTFLPIKKGPGMIGRVVGINSSYIEIIPLKIKVKTMGFLSFRLRKEKNLGIISSSRGVV